ncbi:GNAT family N-acetyltransferase [Halomarina litorea]|uniref:GNAT family N-acetyltransferase n=1 Tax=Halomarina litorea TaxID=2961595 RepID=UPI0020C4B662|nr:hypothetical protein [Halomarina sp. BCD28]
MNLLPLVPDTPAFDRAVDCYWGVFGRSPHGRPDRATAETMFRRHAQFPGYRGLVAATGGSVASPGTVLGYAYGYESRPGQYYRGELAAALPDARADRWLADCFEFVELGVVAHARRQGVGGALHDALLADRPQSTSVLTTGVDNGGARALYADRGWVTLHEPFSVQDGPEMVVLGLDL